MINLPDTNYSVILTKIMLACPGCKVIELPKGHGKLIDVDWMLNKMATTDAQPRTQNEYYAWDFAKTLLKLAPTIIEADSEKE